MGGSRGKSRQLLATDNGYDPGRTPLGRRHWTRSESRYVAEKGGKSPMRQQSREPDRRKGPPDTVIVVLMFVGREVGDSPVTFKSSLYWKKTLGIEYRSLP